MQLVQGFSLAFGIKFICTGGDLGSVVVVAIQGIIVLLGD